MQIEDYEGEANPFMHKTEDTIANMNLAYWNEQMKATIAVTATELVPLGSP